MKNKQTNKIKTRANIACNSKLKTDRLSPKIRTRQRCLLSPRLFNIVVIQLLSCIQLERGKKKKFKAFILKRKK